MIVDLLMQRTEENRVLESKALNCKQAKNNSVDPNNAEVPDNINNYNYQPEIY